MRVRVLKSDDHASEIFASGNNLCEVQYLLLDPRSIDILHTNCIRRDVSLQAGRRRSIRGGRARDWIKRMIVYVERQSQLRRPPARVAIDEALERRWYIKASCGAVRRDQLGQLFRDVARPTPSCVEGDDPDRIRILAVDQANDNVLSPRALLGGLRPGPSDAGAEIIQHEIAVFVIESLGNNGRRTHTLLSRHT